MSLINAMKVSSSGLIAERYRMDIISANIANANTIQTPQQPAYRRQDVILAGDESGVKVVGFKTDQSPLREVNDPNNQFADAKGNVYYSNVKPIEEMVNMIGASRSYEANIAAFNAAKGMFRSALAIGKG